MFLLETLILISAVAISNAALNESALLPHSTCHFSATKFLLFCLTGNYSIPGNFDPSLIPTEVRVLNLGHSGFSKSDYSTIHDNATPLPSTLTNLTRLAVERFTGTNGTRLPIEAFLSNARATLTDLRVWGCHIGTLGSNFLRGFKNLQDLDLRFNDLGEIDVDAFDTWIHLEDGPAVLQSIALNDNYLAIVDWAVFAPVAESLKELDLSEQRPVFQGLTNLTLSKPFKFTNLTRLSLRSNSLDFPSRAILNTWNMNGQSVIELDFNNFCKSGYDEGCSCCEAQEFVTWTHDVYNALTRPRPARLSFTCGGQQNGYNIFPTNATLPLLSNYECCSSSTAPGCSTTIPGPNSSTSSNSRIAVFVFIPLLTAILSRITTFCVG